MVPWRLLIRNIRIRIGMGSAKTGGAITRNGVNITRSGVNRMRIGGRTMTIGETTKTGAPMIMMRTGAPIMENGGIERIGGTAKPGMTMTTGALGGHIENGDQNGATHAQTPSDSTTRPVVIAQPVIPMRPTTSSRR
jgi:hypothetical protein